MATRYFTLIIGVFFLLAALCGLTGIGVQPPPAGHEGHLAVTAQHGMLFGIFPVNVMHNLVHLVSGIAAVACFYKYVTAKRFCQALAIVYGLVTIFGFMPTPFHNVFGLMPVHSADAWMLHLPITLLAAYFGWMAPETLGMHHYEDHHDVGHPHTPHHA